MTAATDQIEARIALHVLSGTAPKRMRSAVRWRRYLLREALGEFERARCTLLLDFPAPNRSRAPLPSGIELTWQWELWVMPALWQKRLAPLVARRVQLPLPFVVRVRDTKGVKRGPDFAMHALADCLAKDEELLRVLRLVEQTTDTLAEAQ